MAEHVGIITFHRAINYGAVLQTYGLWKAIDLLGADVEVIDYRNSHIEDLYLWSWGRPQKLVEQVKWVPTIPLRVKKNRLFRDFMRQETKLSRAYDPETISQASHAYDLVVTGSDQVFAPLLSGDDGAYFCDFASKETRCCSYAASTGSHLFDREEDLGFLASIARLERVSVREASSKDLLERFISQEVRVDVDPSLLLERADWSALADKGAARSNPYVFVYSVNPLVEGLEVAKRIAAERGLEVVYLHNRIRSARNSRDGVTLLHDSKPYDWLRLIRDAECVITNSFHGTAFSLMFQKRFYAEVTTKAGFNNRIWRLLGSVGLLDLLVEKTLLSDSYPYLQEQISWDGVEEVLGKGRIDSLGYLRHMIGD